MEDYIIWAIGALLVGLMASITQLRNEVSRNHSTLQMIAEHMGIPNPLNEITDEEFNRLILERKKIKAIKRLRYLTGMGLKEAKEAVDKIIKENKN